MNACLDTAARISEYQKAFVNFAIFVVDKHRISEPVKPELEKDTEKRTQSRSDAKNTQRFLLLILRSLCGFAPLREMIAFEAADQYFLLKNGR